MKWTDYLVADGKMVGQRVSNTPSGGSATISLRYFVLDHLGSIAVITDESGSVVERLSYDAWGKRRFPTGADDPSGSITSQTSRGFTGHEMIDAVGLVNMNGRVYDPTIGRFMSADPFIHTPTFSQDLNRYSYIHNNPLSFTDANGYGFFKKIGNFFKTYWRQILAVVVAAVLWYALPLILPALIPAFTTLSTVAQFAIIGGISGAAAGAISTGTLKGALLGGLGGAVGGAIFGSSGWGLATKVVASGVAGGVISELSGGNFVSGFLSAGMSAGLGPTLGNWGDVGNLFKEAIIGGLVSKIGGGKFANGAATAAFGYLAGRAADAVTESLRREAQGTKDVDDHSRARGKYAANGEVASDAENGGTALGACPTDAVLTCRPIQKFDGDYGGQGYGKATVSRGPFGIFGTRETIVKYGQYHCTTAAGSGCMFSGPGKPGTYDLYGVTSKTRYIPNSGEWRSVPTGTEAFTIDPSNKGAYPPELWNAINQGITDCKAAGTCTIKNPPMNPQ